MYRDDGAGDRGPRLTPVLGQVKRQSARTCGCGDGQMLVGDQPDGSVVGRACARSPRVTEQEAADERG